MGLGTNGKKVLNDLNVTFTELESTSDFLHTD